MQGRKYIGSQYLGCELVDKITKEEFAAIAFFLAARLDVHGVGSNSIIIDEYNSLITAKIIDKKLIEPAPPTGA